MVKSAFKWGEVANLVFQGASALTLDGKGRLSVPARHRDVLVATAEGKLTITRHPDGCLLVFPRPAWEPFRDRIAALPMSAAGWKRVFLGNAMDVEIDSGSRVLVSPELRAAVNLGSKVMLLGMGSHFELWNAEAYAAHEAEVLAGDMPEAIKDFSF